MIRIFTRLVGGLALLLMALGSPAVVAHALEEEVLVSFDGKAAGDSVVGLGAVHPLLAIEQSGGNDVLAIQEETAPGTTGSSSSASTGWRSGWSRSAR